MWRKRTLKRSCKSLARKKRESTLPTYSISCDSIYISHSVKDMIVPTFVRSGIFPSLSLIFCFGTPWQHSLLFCNDSSCQPYIMMLKDMRFYLQGFTWRTCLQEGCSCLLHWSKEGFLAYFLGSCRIVKNVCFYVASIQRCIIFYLLPLLSWR